MTSPTGGSVCCSSSRRGLRESHARFQPAPLKPFHCRSGHFWTAMCPTEPRDRSRRWSIRLAWGHFLVSALAPSMYPRRRAWRHRWPCCLKPSYMACGVPFPCAAVCVRLSWRLGPALLRGLPRDDWREEEGGSRRTQRGGRTPCKEVPSLCSVVSSFRQGRDHSLCMMLVHCFLPVQWVMP